MSATPSADHWPAPGVHALGKHDPAALAGAAASRGQRWIEIDLGACADKRSALRAIGHALGFDARFGANLDALHDSLGDLPDREPDPGWAIRLHGLSTTGALDARGRETLLEVFRAGAAELADAARELRVFYD